MAALLATSSVADAKQYELPATPTTVAWGHYDAAATPVLTVRSGDTVVVHTLLTNSPKSLEGAGLPADQVEPSLRAVFDAVTNLLATLTTMQREVNGRRFSGARFRPLNVRF